MQSRKTLPCGIVWIFIDLGGYRGLCAGTARKCQRNTWGTPTDHCAVLWGFAGALECPQIPKTGFWDF